MKNQEALSRRETAYKLRKEGKTFKEIGADLGVGPNRARQLFLHYVSILNGKKIERLFNDRKARETKDGERPKLSCVFDFGDYFISEHPITIDAPDNTLAGSMVSSDIQRWDRNGFGQTLIRRWRPWE